MMKKLSVLFAAVLGFSGVAVADQHMPGEKKMDMKMMDMKMLDTNGDGMISKDEFMKHQEMMFDRMKKNASGMVDMKDMQMMRKEMMQHEMGNMHPKKHGDKSHDMKEMKDMKTK